MAGKNATIPIPGDACPTHFQRPPFEGATRNPASTSCMRLVIKIVRNGNECDVGEERERKRKRRNVRREKLSWRERLLFHGSLTKTTARRGGEAKVFGAVEEPHGSYGSLRPCAPPIDPPPPRQPRSPTMPRQPAIAPRTWTTASRCTRFLFEGRHAISHSSLGFRKGLGGEGGNERSVEKDEEGICRRLE